MGVTKTKGQFQDSAILFVGISSCFLFVVAILLIYKQFSTQFEFGQILRTLLANFCKKIIMQANILCLKT